MTSIDGISAYDLISREAMLQGFARVEGGRSALPFVRLFHGALSEYCGRMSLAQHTEFRKVKAESKEMR